MEQIVDRIKPDVIIADNFIYTPSLMNCGIPWVWSISSNPLYIDYAIEDERIPPMASGLCSNLGIWYFWLLILKFPDIVNHKKAINFKSY